MAVDLDTDPTGLFRRVGRLVKTLDSVNAFSGTGDLSAGGLRSLGVLWNNIQAGYTTADRELIDGLFTQLDSARSSVSGIKSFVQQMAQEVVIEMVADGIGLNTRSLAEALAALDAQMKADTDSVDASTASTTSITAASGNVGDATVNISYKRTDGRANELVIAETLTLVCTSDAETGGGATEGQESWSATGTLPADDTLAWDYPKGSGVSTAVTAVSAAEDAGANLVTNGDFESWTSSALDNWTAATGVYGTDIKKQASTVFAGTYALEFLGDGSTLSAITQTTGASSGGTTATISPNTVYHHCLFLKRSDTLTQGVLELALINGDSGAILTDDAGNDCKNTLSYTGITTSYAAWKGSIVTPKNLPASVKIRLRLSTALDNGVSVYMDNLTLTAPDELYAGGPRLSVHSGATPSIRGDKNTVVVANDRAGAFQEAFQKLFDMRSLGLQLRSHSGGSETIDDAWIA